MSDDKDAARSHGKWFVSAIRAWSNSVFLSGLSGNRCQEEKNELVDELYQRCEDIVAQDPEKHALDYIHAYIHIEKL